MPQLVIDGRRLEVPQGTTLLAAAARLGIDIPTLCYLEGTEPNTSCFLCVVQVEGRPELSPACATLAADGMVVHTDTDDVRRARRMALDLMLSDHAGDCVAPCTLACPAHLDVADFIASLVAADPRGALRIIKRTIPFPASLGRICPRFCENVCRRKDLDEPVAICSLRRFAADLDLASGSPWDPDCAPPTGKRVAIVGAGPAGLSAAYYLRQFGHACTLFDARAEPGGLFRYGIDESRLPRVVLDAEIDAVRRLGARFAMNTRLGADLSLDELRTTCDAVLLAIGAQVTADQPRRFAEHGYVASRVELDLAFVAGLGLETGPRGVKVHRHTSATALPGVFAAGGVASGPNYGVYAVAAGRRAAVSIDQFLRGLPVTGEPQPVNVLMRDLAQDELARLRAFADPAPRVRLEHETGDVPRALTPEEARAESRRCLDCDCARRRDCLLRLFSSRYDASPARFRGERRPFDRDASHPDIVYESGKCIQCGICVRIAEESREPLGLTFIGRGFSVRTAAPFSSTVQEALRHAARRCAEACPTGAIALKRPLRNAPASGSRGRAAEP